MPSMKNAELRQLALLCELVDTQSLNEAAARLHMSASAASHSLARLRRDLGDSVLIRGQRGYQLTPYGAQALEAIRQILDLWREASSSAVLFDPARCEARLSMACCDSVGVGRLARFHRDTLDQAPRLQLDIAAPAHGPQDIDDLRAGLVDVVCTHHEPPGDARDLHMETLRRPVVDTCCLRESHPRIGQGLSLVEYAGERHLVMRGDGAGGADGEDGYGAIDRVLMARGLAPRVLTVVQSRALCAELLAQGDRLLSTSAEQAAGLLGLAPGLRCLPLPRELVGPKAALHLVWHQRTHQSRPHRWLRQRLREWLGPQNGQS